MVFASIFWETISTIFNMTKAFVYQAKISLKKTLFLPSSSYSWFYTLFKVVMVILDSTLSSWCLKLSRIWWALSKKLDKDNASYSWKLSCYFLSKLDLALFNNASFLLKSFFNFSFCYLVFFICFSVHYSLAAPQTLSRSLGISRLPLSESLGKRQMRLKK